MEKIRGKFITAEGCEGVGKTRQLKMLKEYLDGAGIEYVLTREPGGTEIAERIRGILLDRGSEGMSFRCEALLYAAARAQHIDDVIAPALKDGKLVICDRYIDSSFAYQGFARGLGFDYIEKINAYAVSNFMPDYTIFLNLSPKEAFSRKGGVDALDRLESSGFEFHERVYEGYLKVKEIYHERIIDIDCSGDKYQTSEKIVKELKKRGII